MALSLGRKPVRLRHVAHRLVAADTVSILSAVVLVTLYTLVINFDLFCHICILDFLTTEKVKL